MLTASEISKFISDDTLSKKKRFARKGADYYEGKHDILKYRIFYFDSNGILREDKYRSNVKIPHPFFMEIVDQAVQYLLSGGSFARSDIPELQKSLDEYFNYSEEFRACLSELLTGCMAKGSEYLYMYRNSENKIAFQTADYLKVVEVREQDSLDGQEYLIYFYDDTEDRGAKKIRRIQVWDREQVSFFVQQQNGVISPDSSQAVNPRPHVLYSKDDGKTYCSGFGFIPFFRLDNNKKQRSDLGIIKELIDDYDLMASSLSNNLIDFDMPLYAVTGFEGDSLDELQTNLKSKKIIGLDEGGGVEIKTVDVPYQARLTKLELDEKNIYRFGMGLNTAGLKDTSATTNIAIKAAYSLLDLRCAKLETRLKELLRKILKPLLDEINRNSDSSYRPEDVRFEFSHEIMSNALENAQISKIAAEVNQLKIQTLMSVAQQLDNETVMRSICTALDIDYEQVREKLDKKQGINQEITVLSGAGEDKNTSPLNGAQMNSLMNIISNYKDGNLSPEAAASVISVSFGITEERAARLLSASEESGYGEEESL
ncbi:MAG: phage portal protein [Porcipelethomonas sp.]